MTVYVTRDEAIAREIVAPLGEFASQHDVEAIADVLIKAGDKGFYLDTNADFWAVAEAHAVWSPRDMCAGRGPDFPL